MFEPQLPKEPDLEPEDGTAAWSGQAGAADAKALADRATSRLPMLDGGAHREI